MTIELKPLWECPVCDLTYWVNAVCRGGFAHPASGLIVPHHDRTETVYVGPERGSIVDGLNCLNCDIDGARWSATIMDGVNLRRVVSELDHAGIRSNTVDGSYIGGLHLAVMTGPFLDLIVAGCKTVESRFHRQRRTPLFTAKPGDVVVFRQSGRPANVAAILGNVHYLDVAESGVDQIRATWASRIGCDDDEFWSSRTEARWVSLLELDSVFSIPPQALHKHDRSAWVTYPRQGKSEEKERYRGAVPG